jgi:hypothetical protein
VAVYEPLELKAPVDDNEYLSSTEQGSHIQLPMIGSVVLLASSSLEQETIGTNSKRRSSFFITSNLSIQFTKLF